MNGIYAIMRGFLAALRHRGAATTVGQLRSDLSHESTSKIACLLSMLGDWRRGRYQATDFGDAAGLLEAIEHALLRHARLAATHLGTWLAVLQVLRELQAGQRLLRRASRKGAFVQEGLLEFEETVRRLRRAASLLVDRLSWHYAVRIEDLAIQAADEVRLEVGRRTGGRDVGIVIDESARLGSTWVPRSDAVRWLDLLRNMIRNAVQAIEDRGPHPAQPGEVVLTLSPLRTGPGTLVTIQDNGVGMLPEEQQSCWRSGFSRHGESRGEGLTEQKQSFLLQRGTFDFESRPSGGTTIRMGVQARDIHVPCPPLLRARPLLIPALMLLSAIVYASIRAPGELVATQTRDATVLVARTEDGSRLWEQNLGEEILENLSGLREIAGELTPAQQPRVILQDAHGRTQGVFVSTLPESGPGAIWRLDRKGEPVWTRRLEEVFPGTPHLGRYLSHWQVLVPWSGSQDQVLVANIRDLVYSPNAILALSLEGRAIATYFHPGNLALRACDDLDDDRQAELLLFGINNVARYDSTMLGFDPQCFVDCVVLLDLPYESGQAFPYTAWEDVPALSEAGYLLIPPLRVGERAMIHMIDIARPSEDTERRIEIRIIDGRVYRTDPQLKPLECILGDDTPAAEWLAGREGPALVYVHHGQRESIRPPSSRGRN